MRSKVTLYFYPKYGHWATVPDPDREPSIWRIEEAMLLTVLSVPYELCSKYWQDAWYGGAEVE